MKKMIQTGLYTVVAVCILWGILVGIFTWDSSKIFPAYSNLISLFISPVTNNIRDTFNKALESKN